MPLLTNPAVVDAASKLFQGQPGHGEFNVRSRPGTVEASLPYQIGTGIGGFLQKYPVLKPVGNYLQNFGYDHGRAALQSALALGLLGGGYGLLTGRSPLKWGLGGLALGGLGGYGLSGLASLGLDRRLSREGQYGKSASTYYGVDDSDPVAFIQARLFEDSSMSSPEKAMLMQAVRQLPPQQASSLAQVLSTVAGGAIGALVAKFLMGMGPIGTVGLGALGGLLGARLSDPTPQDFLGRRINPESDVFGRRRTF